MNGSRRLPVHWLRHVVTLLLLGLAVHLILPQITTLQHSLQVIRDMAWGVIALAAAAQVLSYVGSGLLIRAIAAITGDRLSPIRGALITAASNSIGLVAGGVVASGAAVRRWARGSGVGKEGALLALWLPPLVSTAVLLLITALGLVYLLAWHKVTTAEAVSFGLILLFLGLVIAAFAWGSRRRDRFSGMATRLAGRVAALLHRPYDPANTEASVARVFSGWDRLGHGGWRGPTLGAALTTLFDMLTLYLVFVAAGHPVRPEALLAGYGLPMLLARAPLMPPGGLGVVESSMVALFANLGVPKEVAVVVVLAYRLTSFWLPILVGFALVPVMEHAAGGAEREPAQEGAVT